LAEPVGATPLEAVIGPGAFLVALDGVTDPRNLGAVLRTAAVAGAGGVIVPRRGAALLTPAAVKAAAGAVEHVPIVVVSGIPAALEQLRRAGTWTVGLDADGTTSLFELTVADQALALVLGAEGRGLGRLARERCDVVARIPTSGVLGSLNVASAAAVACFEVVRRRGASGGDAC
jgi:23S rRNA (guanosine2251-2'-O)-methyltransferase